MRITGQPGRAQVNGHRKPTDELWKMQKRVEYGMEYLENWNFLWSIKIIVMTLTGKNAYIKTACQKFTIYLHFNHNR